jgi:hypothetical protein
MFYSESWQNGSQNEEQIQVAQKQRFLKKKKLWGFNQPANYIDQTTATCRRNK